MYSLVTNQRRGLGPSDQSEASVVTDVTHGTPSSSHDNDTLAMTWLNNKMSEKIKLAL